MASDEASSTDASDASVPVAEETKFDDWQVQLKKACEADRLADIEAIVSLRPPQRVVLRHVTTVRDEPQTRVTGNTVVISGGTKRYISREEVVPYEDVPTLPGCPPPPDFLEPGSAAADEFLRHLLRDPHNYSGSCLFWVQSIDALRLLEEKGASTHDKGWMGIPLLVHRAEQGREDMVRFLIEERGHDPSVARGDGYAALHWAEGLDLVRYLIERGADGKALTGFGDSVVAQQVRRGHVDVVDYLLGLGEERVSRANLLHWVGAEPEMFRVFCRHVGVATFQQPIPTSLWESYPPLALQRVLQSGINGQGTGLRINAEDIVECVDILLAHGCDPMLRDHSGRLPYHVVQDLLPDTEDPLRQQLDARLARYDGPRKRPRRNRF